MQHQQDSNRGYVLATGTIRKAPLKELQARYMKKNFLKSYAYFATLLLIHHSHIPAYNGLISTKSNEYVC